MLLVCLLAIGQVWAQTRTVTGKVTDEKGNPVASASVTVKGSNQGTATDASGKFQLTVPQNAKTLVISSVGFVNQETSISGNTVSRPEIGLHFSKCKHNEKYI